MWAHLVELCVIKASCSKTLPGLLGDCLASCFLASVLQLNQFILILGTTGHSEPRFGSRGLLLEARFNYLGSFLLLFQ